MCRDMAASHQPIESIVGIENDVAGKRFLLFNRPNWFDFCDGKIIFAIFSLAIHSNTINLNQFHNKYQKYLW